MAGLALLFGLPDQPGTDRAQIIDGTLEDQTPEVDVEVTATTQQEDIVWIVIAAMALVFAMMRLDAARASAARHPAAAAVADPDLPIDSGRDRLARTLRLVRIDNADVTGIAAHPLERDVIDVELDAATLDLRVVALRAHGHREVVLRARSRLGGHQSS